MRRPPHAALLTAFVLSIFPPVVADEEQGSGGAGKRAAVAVWETRWDDISDDPSDADYQLLRRLLRSASTVEYQVLPGDTLDRLIRTRYLVYLSRHKTAYGLYGKEIEQRNETSSALYRQGDGLLLRSGRKLLLPAGPRFGSLAFGPLAEDAFSDLVASYPRSQGVRAHLDDASLLAEAVSFERGYRAMYFSREKSFDSTSFAEEFGEAYDTFPVEFEQGDEDAPPASSLAGERTLPAMKDVEIDCSGQCRRPREILGLDGGTELALALLLLADSGLAGAPLEGGPEAIVSEDGEVLIARSQILWEEKGAYCDISANRHGTFLFGELLQAFPEDEERQHLRLARVGQSGSDPGAVADGCNPSSEWSFDLVATFDAIKLFRKQVAKRSRSEGVRTGVVNISAHGGGRYPANARLNEPTLLVVVAAGNDGHDWVDDKLFTRFNGRRLNYLVVGALDRYGVKENYSNWNSEYVDLFVQGSCVCGRGKQLNGTSNAAPLAAAAAAILAGENPSWEPGDVKWRLIATSDLKSVSPDLAVGGVLDLPRARASKIEARVKTENGEERVIVADELSFSVEWAGSQPDCRWSFDKRARRNRSSLLRLSRSGVAENHEKVVFEVVQRDEDRCYSTVPADAAIIFGPDEDRKISTARELLDLYLPIRYKVKDGRKVIVVSD